MKEKGFNVLIIILGLTVVSLLIAGAYFFGKSRAIQPALPPLDDTSEWKTYSNVDYGFSVQYPPLFAYSKQTLNPDDIFLFQVRFGSAKEQKFNYNDGFSIEVTTAETLKEEVEYREWRVVGQSGVIHNLIYS